MDVNIFKVTGNINYNNELHVADDVIVLEINSPDIQPMVDSGAIVDLDESLEKFKVATGKRVDELKQKIVDEKELLSREVEVFQNKSEDALKLYYKMAKDAEIEKNKDAFAVIEAYKKLHKE